jgi:hypothetical protein
MSSYCSIVSLSGGTAQSAGPHYPTAQSRPTTSDHTTHTTPCDGYNHNPLSRRTRSCWAAGQTVRWRCCGLSSRVHHTALNPSTMIFALLLISTQAAAPCENGSSVIQRPYQRFCNWEPMITEPCPSHAASCSRQLILKAVRE